MLGTGSRGKDVIISKPLTDIAHVAATQATADDVKSAKDLFTHVIAAIDVDIAARSCSRRW